ncbi:MAG: NAD(P)-dependent oxidoreductase [bacterium]
MKILLTGATGFVGRHIFNKVNTGEHKIMVIVQELDCSFNSSPKPIIVNGDLHGIKKIKPFIKEFSPDVCIHCAWQGIPDYSSPVSKSNLENSIRLFDFVVKEAQCKKIIVTGSCFEYGDVQGLCAESQQTNVTSFFSWAKSSLYHYASLLCHQEKASLIWFRIFYVYGPHQREGSLIPMLVDCFKNNKLLAVKNLFNANDFVYIEDIAEAFKKAVVKNIASGIYNLGSGKSTPVFMICRIIEKKLLKGTAQTAKLVAQSTKTGTNDFYADTAKTKRELAWTASTSLEAGIEKYIESLKG